MDLKQLKLDATLEEVFAHVETVPQSCILFVDQSVLCSQYSQTPWVGDHTQVVQVDEEIVDNFQIGKVPQFRFYVQGSEVASLVGTASYEEFIEIKERIFGNSIGIK